MQCKFIKVDEREQKVKSNIMEGTIRGGQGSGWVGGDEGQGDRKDKGRGAGRRGGQGEIGLGGGGVL